MIKAFKNYINSLTPHRRACAVLLVFFVLFSVSHKIFSSIAISDYIATALALIAPIVIVLSFYLFITKPDRKRFFRVNKVSASDIGLWFFLGVCANCALTVIDIPINAFWQQFFSLPRAILSPHSFGEYIVGVICIAVVPAVFEELFCRGIILREYENYGRTFAIIASALAFLVLHNSVTSAVSMLLLGLMLAFIVTKTNSIFPAMIFHFALNFFSLTVSYISESVIPYHLQSELSLVINILFIFLALTFFITVFSVLSSKSKKSGRTKKIARPKMGFSFSLIIVILIYIFTQLKFFM